jgi:hypothetical protein
MCAPCVHRVCTMGAPCLSKDQKISQFRTSAQKFIWKRNGAYTVHTVHTRCTDGAPHDVHTVFQHRHVNDHCREAPKEKNTGFCSVEAHKNVCALLCAFVRRAFWGPRVRFPPCCGTSGHSLDPPFNTGTPFWGSGGSPAAHTGPWALRGTRVQAGPGP